MNTFFIEITDTYGDNLNYCWVKHFSIKANTLRGAICKLSKETGFKFRNNGLYYKATNASVGAAELFTDYMSDEEIQETYNFIEI